MKYRKKPIVIEASQWMGGEQIPPAPHDLLVQSWGRNDWFLRTLEGEVKLTPLDWLICGVKGEWYPCKPDIFEQTYEPVP